MVDHSKLRSPPDRSEWQIRFFWTSRTQKEWFGHLRLNQHTHPMLEWPYRRTTSLVSNNFQLWNLLVYFSFWLFKKFQRWNAPVWPYWNGLELPAIISHLHFSLAIHHVWRGRRLTTSKHREYYQPWLATLNNHWTLYIHHRLPSFTIIYHH